MQIMEPDQTLSIRHIPNLISSSPIMNLMKISFYNHDVVAIDLWTQPFKLHRTTLQLLRSIDPLYVYFYSYSKPIAANIHYKDPYG